MERSLEVIDLLHILSLYPNSDKYSAGLKFAVAHRIELEIYKKCKSPASYQCEMYTFKTTLNPRSIANNGAPNMLMKRIYQFMTVVLLGDILPEHIYDLLIDNTHNISKIVNTPAYAFSENNMPHMEYADRRSKSKINYKTTKLYECSKCHMRETIIIEKQVRCLDEPTTAFITCMKCGHMWKN